MRGPSINSQQTFIRARRTNAPSRLQEKHALHIAHITLFSITSLCLNLINRFLDDEEGDGKTEVTIQAVPVFGRFFLT